MEIFPRDLGRDHYLDILRRRLSPLTGATPTRAPAGETEGRTPQRRGLRLARFWTRGLGLDEADAEKLSAVAWSSAPGSGARVGAWIISLYLGLFALVFVWQAPSVALFLLAVWTAIVPLLLLTPRFTLRRSHRKVLDATEVEALLPYARGRLDQAYLNLVRDALRAEVPSPSAQADIRAALQALGDTVARLPAERAPVEDSLTVRASAQRLKEQAARETDTLVRESLLRQAATLEKRAGSADGTARLARRIQTLRREARVQMDALRAVLVGFDQNAAAAAGVHLSSDAAVASASKLADAVQRAAQEAQAAAVARAELENDELAHLLGRPLPAPTAAPTQPAAPVQQQVVGTNGGGATAAAPAEAPQQGQNRIWWRNGGG